MNEALETPHAAEESTSLADHESAFSPETRTETPAAPVSEPDDAAGESSGERDGRGRFKPRRAESQRATPADVELINQYTKRLREAEDALGVTIEKKDGESERVYQLRRRAELAEIRRDLAKKPAPPAAAAPVKREPPKPFDEARPKYEDFANEEDQYQAHILAVAAWDRRREAAEGAKTTYETTTKAEIEARNAARDKWFQEQEAQHLERMQTYHAKHPEAQKTLEAAGDVWLTPAMYAAVMTAENSPELLMRVAQDESLRDDLIDLTDGKPLTKDLVDRVQRRLNRGLQAGTTGAATPQSTPVPAVPRPPTPVRTGPMTAADTPPGDEDSLAAHEKFYGRKRR